MSPGKSLLRLALGAAALAGIAGVLALSPRTPSRALADGPQPTPTGPTISFPQGINWWVPLQTSPPHLSNFELQSLVAPGGLIKVDGENFGAVQGSGGICMQWTNVLVNNDFTAHSRLCLDVIDWSDTRVIAQVPRDVVGVPDQTAYVSLQRDDGFSSGSLPIGFVATRQTVQMGSVPANVQISCSDGSSNDICTPGGGNHSDFFFFSTGSNGTDTYNYHLANGWKFESMNFSIVDGGAAAPAKPAYGATDFTLQVSWDFGGFTTRAIYNFGIEVTGPAGVPMQ